MCVVRKEIPPLEPAADDDTRTKIKFFVRSCKGKLLRVDRRSVWDLIVCVEEGENGYLEVKIL